MGDRRGFLLAMARLGLAGTAAAGAARGSDAAGSGGGAGGSDPGGWPGGLDGVWHWRLPETPNGFRPSQSWHATGSAPDGSIYVAGMDHATNSALYRLDTRTGTLRFVGDARSASEAAGNWRPGETAEKFHTRPLWHGGKVYVATMDRSMLDDGYLSRRGFHWYAHDPERGGFADLSAAEPGGTGAPHGALVTLASDPARGVIYGAGVPTAEIFRYDVARGRTENLGRPPSFDRAHVYANRVMWVDGRGRLHFTAGNVGLSPHDPSVYGHVHYYDPGRGGFGERRDWRLRDPRALEGGQCLDGGRRCFFTDDQGHLYRFEDEGPSWAYLGRADLPDVYNLLVWVFQVSADGKKAYLATSRGERALHEFDLVRGSSRRLCDMAALGPALAGLSDHTGYDAWDRDGRFYVTSFSPDDPDRGVILTRVDPVRLKAALGVLPTLVEVSVDRASAAGAAGPAFVFARTGGSAEALEVRYEAAPRGPGSDGIDTARARHGTVTIPRGAASVTAALPGPPSGEAAAAAHGGVLSVVPNGNDYVAAGAGRSVVF